MWIQTYKRLPLFFYVCFSSIQSFYCWLLYRRTNDMVNWWCWKYRYRSNRWGWIYKKIKISWWKRTHEWLTVLFQYSICMCQIKEKEPKKLFNVPPKSSYLQVVYRTDDQKNFTKLTEKCLGWKPFSIFHFLLNEMRKDALRKIICSVVYTFIKTQKVHPSLPLYHCSKWTIFFPVSDSVTVSALPLIQCKFQRHII